MKTKGLTALSRLLHELWQQEHIAQAIGDARADHIGNDIRLIIIPHRDTASLEKFYPDTKCIGKNKEEKEQPQQDPGIGDLVTEVKGPEKNKSSEHSCVHELVELGYPEACLTGQHLAGETAENSDDDGPQNRCDQLTKILP